MKKVVTLMLIGMVFTLILSACGSSKGGTCDAYGSVDQNENTDLASK